MFSGRCERVRANLGTTRARGEVDMEITLRKMQHKEDKMQRTASQFQEMEQTVYNSLFTLIKDTSVLRDYAAAALLIINVSVLLCKVLVAGLGQSQAACIMGRSNSHCMTCPSAEVCMLTFRCHSRSYVGFDKADA